MAKLKQLSHVDKLDPSRYYVWHCPGCEELHQIKVPHWTFNEDLDKPDFEPSYLVFELVVDGRRLHHRCHSYIKNGQMRFLGDCTHKLAGQTVEIPDVSYWIGGGV